MSSKSVRRVDNVKWSVSRAVNKGFYGCAWDTTTGEELHATNPLPSLDDVYAELRLELCRILNLPPDEALESASGQILNIPAPEPRQPVAGTLPRSS